ncbi:MAG: SagB/ThcOx family dehydrogenase [Bacteroidales bacterium]|nr:SagB/ThcOx family dehydrogenase [Bacteroidales bacterium]
MRTILMLLIIINMKAQEILLPKPLLKGQMSVEEALYKRRSIRNYSGNPLTIEQISQLLWAAYGVTKKSGSINFKTAPSAGAIYPLEIYLLVNTPPKEFNEGLYKYNSNKHSITLIKKGSLKNELSKAAYNENMILEASICIIITANYSKTIQRYGERGRDRYVCMDAGHVGQNIYLQATSLGLGTCAIGAFEDDIVTKVLNLPKEETPLYIFPIGTLK